MSNIAEIKFKPSPGYILLSPIEESQGLTKKTDTRKGTVVAVGDSVVNQFGTTVHCPCKVGDVIQREFKYEADILLDNKKYELILFTSCQGVYV